MTANGAGPTAVAWPASEVESSATLVRDTDAVVALSQSGETADVLDALTVARERGATTVGLINAEHSSAERLLDLVVPLCAGHERSVLATKSFMAMLARLWQLVHEMNGAHPDCTRATLLESAELVRAGLREPEAQQWTTKLATSLASRESAMVVSGGAHLPIADEAALKIKEGTYVHAESVRTGELKHGVIALVEAGYPCLLMAPDGQASNRLGIAAEELRTRGADVYWVGPGRPAGLGTGGPVISSGSPFVQTALIQRVALETALQRGVDPDYPRNLAKSVTVR
jgi:glucosamine--fructose-6-phosphate aminotransferase (isomerizing)